LWFNFCGLYVFYVSLFLSTLLSYFWWRDTARESSVVGSHSKFVKSGLKFGMVFFIISEVMFFLSFFWRFVHNRRSSDVELGSRWPPVQVFPFNPLALPLVNTVILLSSGVSVTWAHHLMLKGDNSGFIAYLGVTVLLGVFFSLFQGVEYIMSVFSLSDRSIGSVFFLSTGFHGLHVMVGFSFLSVIFLKQFNLHRTGFQRVGFECSAWY